jgi:hypothetical protein
VRARVERGQYSVNAYNVLPGRDEQILAPLEQVRLRRNGHVTNARVADPTTRSAMPPAMR